MSWFYYFARWVLRRLLHLTRWQVLGRGNIPAEGPLIVVANHLSLADPPVLSVSIDRTMVFMAKRQLFRFWPISYFVRSFGAFPVNRGHLDRKALRQARAVLERGLALIMFPEGMRSRRRKLKEAFPGVALIALQSGALVLPVAITGTEKLKSGFWRLKRPRITVNIGPAFHPAADDGRLDRTALNKATRGIMRHIAMLLPPEYRGIYAEEESDDITY